MEQSKPFMFLSILLLLACSTRSAHGMRLLHDVDAEEFTFGSMAAAETETAPRDAYLDDYEDEISSVEFEPERGTSYAATVGAAAAGPALGPATAGSDAAVRTGTSSMKWWLPPSTMPSFPMFPNPGGMPGMPIPALPVPLPALPGMPAMPMAGGLPGGGMPMPMPMPGGIPAGGLPMPMPGGIPGGGMPLPGMPMQFKPNGWGSGAGVTPSPPSQAQPTTPPAASASEGANDDTKDNPIPNEIIH